MKRQAMTSKATLLVLLLLAGITSCNKALDVNTDPNNPSLEQLTPKLVFPAAVASVAGRIGSDFAIIGGIWAGYYTQGTTANQYKNIEDYNLTKTYGSTSKGVTWVELFSGALNDLHFVIEKSKQQEDWNFYLMGTVMKAYTYQVLVDLYDKAPYTEAFQGAANLQPHFDDGYTIYKGLLAELDTALSKNFSASSNTAAGPADFVFPTATESAWSIEPWIRFANTLKLKMYLRMVYAKPAEAEAGIRDLYEQGAQFLEQDAAMDVFENSPDKRNPLYTYNFVEIGTDANLKASVTFLSWLQANNDPRIDDYFLPRTGTTNQYLGIHQGNYPNNDPALNGSSIARVNPTDPVDFVSLAESHFLQAEALERYFGGAGAKEQYDAGVTASFQRYGDNAAPFLAPGGKYAYPSGGSFEEKLEAIIVQKWASMPKSHAIEAFFERNRTGYPRISPVYSTDASYVPGQIVYSENGITNGLFPKRLIFPDLETSRNANAPADEPLTAKVWWDVR
jgi:hypothetical protein